jgi:hypothetical protein
MEKRSIFGALLAVVVVAALAFIFLSTDPQPATGHASLNWAPPTEREDGSSLQALGGYRIYYGRDPENLDHSIALGGDVIEYRVDGLAPGAWYFAVAAISEDGLESRPSSVVTKTIEPSLGHSADANLRDTRSAGR